MMSLAQIIAQYPPPMDFIFLGGHENSSEVLYLDLCEEDFGVFCQRNLINTLKDLTHSSQPRDRTDHTVYLGVLSYDDYACMIWDPKHRPSCSQLRSSSSQIRIHRGLDHQDGLKLMGDPTSATQKYFQAIGAACDEIYDQSQIQNMQLQDHHSKAHYLRTAHQVIDDIQRGRYYQLNLLRYFDIKGLPEGVWSDDHRIWHSLMDRFIKSAEMMSAVVGFGDELVISFSPERFVSVRPSLQDCDFYLLETFPIKGTVSRGEDPDQDHRHRQWLMKSSKDRRELNMIIDLMRHDLARVSYPATTQVISEGVIVAHSSVFHRVAHISSCIRHNLSWGEFFQTLLPAGSITGAPKVEVIQAIRDYESTPRGVFMGHIFKADHQGFDSSVLIRTLTHSPSRGGQYAAGSGLVFDSSPEKEYEEIQAKCAMWHDQSFAK